MIDKERVAHTFGESASLYHYEARAQRQIAQHLMQQLTPYVATRPHTVLEVGCGTGLLTELVTQHYAPTHYTLNDISAAMLRTHATVEGRTLVCGDAEQCDLGSGYDLVVSSSTMQWFAHPKAFVARMATLLHTGGVIALSTFGERNLQEVATLTGGGLNYLSLSQLTALFDASWQLEVMCEEEITMRFPSPIEVLRHLKRSGVNALDQPAMGWRETQLFLKNYAAQYSHPEGVSLTYHPIYMVATKR